MKKIKFAKILGLFLSLALFSCGGEDDNYKAFNGPQEALLFNNTTSILEVTANASSSVDVVVSSTTRSNVDRVIPISVSSFTAAAPNQYSIDLSTAVIPAGETTAVVKVLSGDFNSLPINGGVDLVLVFDENEYSLPNRSNHVVSIRRGCLDTRATLNITFDGYASEISWLLTNSAGATVAASSGYADGLGSYNQVFCLTPGTYTFIMNDSYGDGLSFPSLGNFTITLPNGTLLANGGGNFGATTGPINFTIQ